MRYIKLIVALVLLVSMSACTADKQSALDMQGYINTIKFVGPGEIEFEPISGTEQTTKATSVDDGIALVFNWAVGDTLGIFPNKGNQVEFPITSQESSTSATFDGGGWALRNNASYAAYYPFSVWNYFQDNKTVIMDYSGQVQNGNGSFEHLSAYDFLASAKTTPENNMVTFQMDRQGSILYIDIVVPEPATVTSLTISCNEAIFVEKAALDISGDNPVVKPVETKESLTLSFENTATTRQNETVRAYMAVQPVDFSNKTVTATLRTTAGAYTAPVVSRVVSKGKAAFLRFSSSFTAPTPEAVDLGLPSGLKWASFNLGASAPEEYGDYFAWGDTEPNYTSQDPLTWRDNKTGYNWASYKFYISGGDWGNATFSKYNTSSDYGPIDNKTVLDPEDDAATVNWGDTWRMPTEAEWTELRTECTWTWTTQNGINGELVTGSNGNSIFLPAAGYRYDTYLDNVGSGSLYWSSSLYTGRPDFAFVCTNWIGVIRDSRFGGFSVRPVTDEGVRVSVTNVSLDNDSLNLSIYETATLTATVTPSNATQPAVIWSSSDNTVATVDYTGKVTAVASGTTTITATTYDGGFTATCSVTVMQGTVVGEDPFDVGSDLSVNGTANCYIVPKAGNYSFDASVMGNGPQGFIWNDEEAAEQFLWPTEQVSVSFTNYGSEKPNQASVLWDDNNVITDVSIDSDLKVSFTATGNKGNAVIIVKNKQLELLWSWHIWCTDSPARLYHETIDGIRIVMLDRNLGAISANPADGAATYGYWYQFGRKDPLKLFYGVAGSMVEGDQSMQASVENPSTIYRFIGKDNEWFNGSVNTITSDLWGNPYAIHNGAEHMYAATMDELRKTIYDPCPPGYMVPPEWAWDSFNMDNCTVGDNGLTFTVENGEAFYPFAGFGDQGDEYGGDNGWYGYPGYTPNHDSSGKWHHNLRNVVCCWSSGSAMRYDPVYNSTNYHWANMFMYMQNEEASGNTVQVNENSKAYLYNQFGHVRQRSCSVRCMKIPD